MNVKQGGKVIFLVKLLHEESSRNESNLKSFTTEHGIGGTLSFDEGPDTTIPSFNLKIKIDLTPGEDDDDNDNKFSLTQIQKNLFLYLYIISMNKLKSTKLSQNWYRSNI
ncbi:hypothetical protein Glove_74g279 [Diversispora epigaea]|uniref:Uncharacterized protein n=1 Tax=Diversispora epigaea TaxID=1348612 RepID=A0A397JDE5_9GLOM|nr:hypothetical protein Glove_74g279 [Diversispora epigaea]